MSRISLLSTLANRCPRCGRGRVFEGLLKMREACDSCGFLYEQESGDYFGATVLSYGIGALIALPLFFVLLFMRLPVLVVLGIPVLVLALVAPFSVRFSKLGWMYLMCHLNPRRQVRTKGPRPGP